MNSIKTGIHCAVWDSPGVHTDSFVAVNQVADENYPTWDKPLDEVDEGLPLKTIVVCTGHAEDWYADCESFGVENIIFIPVRKDGK